MQVKVMFLDSETNQFEHVATVTVPRAITTDDERDACEYAFLRTQNIFGSWSKGPFFADGEPNEDYNENVEVIAPLQTYMGNTLGHRSSMVGDRFIVNDNIYICRGIGFSRYDENLAKQFLGS